MKKSLLSLTSLRFLAALAIVVEHSRPAFPDMQWAPASLPYDFGVSFFFVLSGFILTYSYDNFKGPLLWRFYIARIARIWPLHLATIVICLTLMPSHVWFAGQVGDSKLVIGLSNFFLIHAWVPKVGYFFSLNYVSWSISTEFFFYLVFPFLRTRFEITWKWKAAAVLAVLVLLMSVAVVVGLPSVDMTKTLDISSDGVAYISPFARLAEFVMGMLAALIFLNRNQHARFSPVMATFFEAAAISLVIVGWLTAKYLAGLSMQLTGGVNAWTVYFAHNGAAWSFAVLIGVMAHGQGLFSRVLSIKPLVILGEASFALYLVHQLILTYYFVNIPTLHALAPLWVLCLVYWMATFIAAFALWALVEVPARNKIRRWALGIGVRRTIAAV